MLSRKPLQSDPKTIRILTTILLYALVVYALWTARIIFFGALLGYILYCILHKISHRVSVYTKSLSFGIVASCVILVTFLIIGLSVVTYVAIDLGGQAKGLWGGLSEFIPPQMTSSIDSIDLQGIQDYLKENMGRIRNGLGNVASSIGQFFSIVMFSVVFTIIFLVEPKWIQKLAVKINKLTNSDIQALARETRDVLYIWFWQQAKVGIIVAVILFVYMFALQALSGQDVGNIWMISSLGFFGEFVPLLGPLVSWIPVGAASFGVSPTAGAISVVFFIVLQLVEQYVLIPRIVGSKLDMPATWSVVLLLVGGSLFGVLGVLLSLPIGALLYRKIN